MRSCPRTAPEAERKLSNTRYVPTWTLLSVLTATAALAGAGAPRPELEPFEPLPAGRWPAPYAERSTKGGGPVIVVDTTADTVGTDGACSLREAVDNANAGADTTGGDCAVASTITFDPATDGVRRRCAVADGSLGRESGRDRGGLKHDLGHRGRQRLGEGLLACHS